MRTWLSGCNSSHNHVGFWHFETNQIPRTRWYYSGHVTACIDDNSVDSGGDLACAYCTFHHRGGKLQFRSDIFLPKSSIRTAQYAFLRCKSVKAALRCGLHRGTLEWIWFHFGSFPWHWGVFKMTHLRKFIPLFFTEWIDVMLSSRLINLRIGERSVRRSITGVTLLPLFGFWW